MIKKVHEVTIGLWPEPVGFRDQSNFPSCVNVSPGDWTAMVRDVIAGH